MVLSCVAAGLSLASCEKEPAGEAAPQPKVSEEVVLRNGILVFKDRKTMREFNARLNAKGTAYADQWEQSLGFESMAHILNEVKAAETQLEVDFLRGKTAAQLTQLRQQPALHSALYTKWVNAGVLRAEKSPDGGETLDVNASHTHYTNVMNADGMVAFGDTLYQYRGNKIKVTTKGLGQAAALKAASASDAAQHITVKTSPFRYESQQGQQRTNEITYNGNQWRDAYNGSKQKAIIKVSLYSEILYDAHKQNFVDFWIEARCLKKNFWGNWVDESFGDGIWGIEATYSWTAQVNPFWYSTMTLNVPGYTPGNAYVYYVPDTHPGTIKMDYTTGAPQFGNQLFPNGTYTPYFDPSTGYNYYISQGIKIDNNSIFKCIPVNFRPEAVLYWAN
ncbi:hypothetical protein DLM85_16630 [Hymenobacter edaphi]|uniref:DUF4848 domain-containing protein n=1 Tax=Hymenobacter edaphi TaxID=2211146 RepID=A0A328BDH9_9BACT|nr:hypothetical protein DLM85_16630 [Hymenobacter edaphi]